MQVRQTRRQWLKRTAATLGFPTVIPASALGLDGRPAPSERTTLGLIGCGGRAWTLTRSFLKDERVQILAACDVETESTRYNQNVVRSAGTLGREPMRRLVEKQQGEGSCASLTDFRDLLQREDIDAVQIATPDHWHALQVIAAARAGKHIYGEKPLSLTLSEGRLMSDTVRSSGIVWQTGSQQRSDLHFRLACEMIRNQQLGTLQRIEVGLASDNRDNNRSASQTEPAPVPKGFDYDFWLGPAPGAPFCPARLHSNWRWFYDYSGGNVTDFGAHHLDIVQWALDKDETGPVELDQLRATWPSPGSLYTTPITFGFHYRYADGPTIQVADRQDFGSGIRFVGERGSLTCMRGGLKFDPLELRQPLPEDAIRLYESRDHFRNFIDAIQQGVPSAAPIEASHRAVSIAHLANIGLRLNRSRLEWNPEQERVIGDEEADAMRSRPMREPWSLS